MIHFCEHRLIIKETSENNRKAKSHVRIYSLCKDSLDYGKISAQTKVFLK